MKHTLGFDFPNLPYLIDENEKGETVRLTESHAIYRYICGKYNPELLGKTLEDRGKVDMFLGFAQDMRTASYQHIYETGDKEAVKKIGFERMEPISRFLGDKQFIVGDYVTYPDFLLYEWIEMYDYICD